MDKPRLDCAGPRGVPSGRMDSPAFALLEDRTVWTRSWVCVGATHAIPNAGDLLPYTVGNQGIHVERLAGGGLAARFNKAPHGGCRFVPVQCQTGTKTKCSFTSCGHSRDRGVLKASDEAASHQYLGLRPERLVTVPVVELAPLLFVHLGDRADDMPPLLVDHPALRTSPAAPECWQEYHANWKTLGRSLAAGGPLPQTGRWLATEIAMPSGRASECRWLFPNLILFLRAQSACAIVMQPTALGQTLLRITQFGDPVPWLKMISARSRAAEITAAAPGDPVDLFLRRALSEHLGGAYETGEEMMYHA